MGCASSNPLANTGKNLMETAKDGKDNAIAAGEKVVHDAGNVVSTGVDHVKQAVESGLNTVQTGIENITNSIDQTLHSTKENTENTAKVKIEQVKDTVGEAMEDGKHVLLGDNGEDVDTLSTAATVDEFGETINEIEKTVETLKVEDVEDMDVNEEITNSPNNMVKTPIPEVKAEALLITPWEAAADKILIISRMKATRKNIAMSDVSQISAIEMTENDNKFECETNTKIEDMTTITTITTTAII